MTIKTQDGSENVASLGLGQLGTTLGAIGTGLGILNGGLGMLGGGVLGGNRMMNSNDPESSFVTRHELNLVQQIQAKDLALSEKQAELNLKASEAYTDKKMVEVYANLETQINRVTDKMEVDRRHQEEVNATQMAWNATANGTISAMANQIANLSSVTKVFIPQSNICENGCGCGCANS